MAAHYTSDLLQVVEAGLSAIVINNRWYAHKKTLDEWFQHITRARMERIPQDAE